MKSLRLNIAFCLLLAISLSGCSLDGGSTSPTRTKTNSPDNLSSDHAQALNNIKNFEIVAYNFFYSQPEITVKKDDKVTITLISADGQHDILINDYNIQSTVTDINNKTEINFVADKAGEFEFYSSIGDQKERGLVGKLVVQP